MDNDSISPITLDVIRRAQEAGIDLLLISGRSDGFVRSFARMIGSSMPVISLNGALVKNAAGTVMDAARMKPGTARSIMECAEKFPDARVAVFTPDGIFTESARMMLPRYLIAHPDEHHRVTTVMEHIDEVVLFVFTGSYSSLQGISLAAMNSFRGLLDRSLYQSRSGREHYYLEIRLAGISKGLALRNATQSLGISRNETAAIGDYSNDVEMLRFAGVSAAMRNGSDDVKRIADFITLKTNNDNGVAEFLEYILRSRK